MLKTRSMGHLVAKITQLSKKKDTSMSISLMIETTTVDHSVAKIITQQSQLREDLTLIAPVVMMMTAMASRSIL